MIFDGSEYPICRFFRRRYAPLSTKRLEASLLRDETDNSHAGDNCNGQHGNDPVESLKEAQDGTNGGVEDPDIAGRD